MWECTSSIPRQEVKGWCQGNVICTFLFTALQVKTITSSFLSTSVTLKLSKSGACFDRGSPSYLWPGLESISVTDGLSFFLVRKRIQKPSAQSYLNTATPSMHPNHRSTHYIFQEEPSQRSSSGKETFAPMPKGRPPLPWWVHSDLCLPMLSIQLDRILI